MCQPLGRRATPRYGHSSQPSSLHSLKYALIHSPTISYLPAKGPSSHHHTLLQGLPTAPSTTLPSRHHYHNTSPSLPASHHRALLQGLPTAPSPHYHPLLQGLPKARAHTPSLPACHHHTLF